MLKDFLKRVQNFTKKEVDITFNQSAISLRELVELLSSIHYIPDLSQSLSDKEEDTQSYKKLLYKIGVAGFVFGESVTGAGFFMIEI